MWFMSLWFDHEVSEIEKLPFLHVWYAEIAEFSLNEWVLHSRIQTLAFSAQLWNSAVVDIYLNYIFSVIKNLVEYILLHLATIHYSFSHHEIYLYCSYLPTVIKVLSQTNSIYSKNRTINIVPFVCPPYNQFLIWIWNNLKLNSTLALMTL